ncbi:MAG: hypothetical protein ACPG5B_01810 [Chitinophagales bacterium]
MTFTHLRSSLLFSLIAFYATSFSISATAENIIFSDNFDNCSIDSWMTTSGTSPNVPWTFGTPTNANMPNTSINGSCFAYFDDDVLGADTLTNGTFLVSPTFDATAYSTLSLEFDLHFKNTATLSSSLEMMVSNGTETTTVAIFREDIGTSFADAQHQTVDISSFRSDNMSVFFLYKDGGGQAFWVGIDNFEIKGTGSVSCANAESLTIGEACQSAYNTVSEFEGTIPACVNDTGSSVWYSFVPTSSEATITTNSDFNDVVTIFENDCATMTEIACSNSDIYGFVGETVYLDALTIGQTYLIRISGYVEDCVFGAEQGSFCIEITDGIILPTAPVNDICNNAIALNIDAICVAGNNQYATFDGPVPSLNKRSDHSIWYSFTAPNDGSHIAITTLADFADVITVFSGSCGNLSEVACTDFGQKLLAADLVANQTYFIQVSSFFNTIYGDICISLESINNTPANNDFCIDAIPVTLGATCTYGNNETATFSGIAPSCEIKPESSIWFSFVAPTSKRVRINTGADFIHVLSLYEGECDSLTEKSCAYNPYKCDDDVLFTNLTAGQLYYLQITSAENPFGYMQGNVCIRIKDATATNVTVQLKVALEGTYQAGLGEMRTILSESGLIPTEQPYNVAPYNYMGSECVAKAAENAVDWVLVEMRDAANPTTIVEQKAVLLYADGTINDNGRVGISFSNLVENANYHVVVRHRNHLDIMSGNPITVPNENIFDFTVSAATTMGGQLTAASDGTYMMYAGDATGEGIITTADLNAILSDISTFNNYTNADCTLDNTVTIGDYGFYKANSGLIGVSQIRF